MSENLNIWKRLEQEVIDLLGGAWPSYELPESNFTDFVLNIYYDLNNQRPRKGNCYCGVKDKHYSPNRGLINCISELVKDNRLDWARDMLAKLEIAIATVTINDDKNKIKDPKTLQEIEAAIIYGLRQKLKDDYKITKDLPSNVETVFYGGISRSPKGKTFEIAHEGDKDKMPKKIRDITSYPQK